MLAAAALLASGSWAQSIGAEMSILRLKQKIGVVGTQASPVINPAKCDLEGNIYVRLNLGGLNLAAPVIKVSPDGEDRTVFFLDPTRGLGGAQANDFAADPSGERLFMIVVRPNSRNDGLEGDVVAFGHDGHVDSTTELKPFVDPFKLAVFSSGNFLVSGMIPVKKVSKSGLADKKMEPFTGVFRPDGDLVKKVEINQPLSGAVAADGGATGQFEVPTPISLGTAEMGDDGNAYLMSHESKPEVFVISPEGVILRYFRISPPSSNANLLVMKYGTGGRLAFLFSEPSLDTRMGRDAQIVSVADAEDGKILYSYKSPDSVGGALACYTPPDFTFIGSTKEGQLALEKAGP